jgi:sugar phosphate isomerase/epimerase
MSIVVSFPSANITKEQYASVRRALEQAGEWPTDGCQVHVSFGDKDDIRVSEVWESREKLEAFGAKLGPIFEAEGIQLTGQPEIFEAHVVETF